MTSIQVDHLQGKYLISIDKSSFDIEWLQRLIQRLRTEELAKQLDLGEDIENLGETIKEDWWAKNKSRFIND